jgi:hypothetical protein
MYILLIIIVIIIIIYNLFYNQKKINIGTYCNKHGLCIQINENNKVEFELVKSKLFNFYLKLVETLPGKDSRTMRLRKNFQINNMFEVYPNNKEGDTSYSINKGEEIGVCVRSGKNFYNIHNLNIIKFVFIHELAHVMSVSEQHTEEFWKNFKFLLHNCYINNLLKKIDYSTHPEEYCGLDVSYSPYFDQNINVFDV